jgi:hypothetical protein
VPTLDGLEARAYLSIVRPQITVAARPPVLPNAGGPAVVTILGQIASTRDEVTDGFFRVTDQYRQYEPYGDVALTPLGPSGGYYRFGFQFNVTLRAEARSNTPSGGRQYFVLVGATDDDNTEGRTITVFVPGVSGPTPGAAFRPRTPPPPRGRP